MVINEKPVSWTIALAVALVASCGKTTEDAGSQQDPIPGAACDGTQSRLSSDGCLDCTCEADHWNCIELCSSEGGQGGSLGTDVAKGGKGGRTWDEDDLDGQAGWHMGGAPPAGCEIDSLVVEPDFGPTDQCDVMYRCADGFLFVSCDGEGDDSSLCDCKSGDWFRAAPGLFYGTGADPCFSAVDECMTEWTQFLSPNPLINCDDPPSKTVIYDAEVALAVNIIGAWFGCGAMPLRPEAAGIEFREDGTWSVLFESETDPLLYVRGSSEELTGTWGTDLDTVPILMISDLDGALVPYPVSFSTQKSFQMVLAEGESAAGTGLYARAPLIDLTD